MAPAATAQRLPRALAWDGRHDSVNHSEPLTRKKPMSRKLSSIAPDWWDYTTLDAELIRDAAALTPEKMVRLSRPGFRVVLYETLEEFYLAEALEYIAAWRQSTPDNPVGICGPIGPTEHLPLVARLVNELNLDLRSAHFWTAVTTRYGHIQQTDKLLEIVRVRVQAADLGWDDPGLGQATANVAVRHEQVVSADDRIRRVEDFLKVITELAAEPSGWNLELVPTTEPQPDAPEIDVDRAVEAALAQRPDYQAAQVALDTRDIALDVARNGLLPKLDLEASLGYMGLGSSWSRASESFDNFNHYQWSAGIVLEYPLGNRAARARYQRATLDRQQAGIQLRALERQIQLEVRNAARTVATSAERLRAAEASVKAEETRVRAEELLFREGGREDGRRRNAQDVVFAQDALADAERRRLRALIDLNAALVELERAKGTLLDSSHVLFVGE